MRAVLLALLSWAAAEDLITAEVEETKVLIGLYEQRLEELNRLRSELLGKNETIPVGDMQTEQDFRDFQTRESVQSHRQIALEQIFLKKADLHLGPNLVDFVLFALTTGAKETGLIALCYSSGLVVLHETNGREVGNFTVNGVVDTCSAFATSEELSIAVAVGPVLVLTTLKQAGELQVVKQTETQLSAQISALRVSSRGAKRAWIATDKQGNLSAYHFNGTQIRTNSIAAGPLLGLETSGYSLIAAEQRQLAVVNPTSGEVLLRCDKSLKPLIAFASDGSPVVWSLLEDGSVIVHDTQYSAGGGTATCKSKS
jgi:hypothetical protein